MNGKKAKLMRKYGKVDKQTKRRYNTLSSEGKRLISDIYQFNVARRRESEKLNGEK